MFKGTEIIKAGAGMPVKDTASRLMGEMLSRPRIYGWHVDPSISDPSQAVTYLADARGKAPAAMGDTEFSYGGWEKAFFMPKPCMLRYDGTVAYYLDPDDYTKKADGTASDVADTAFDGNAMMEWPLIWYKFEAGEAEGEGYFYCSDRQVDESYHCWCNYDSNNNIIPHFYTAIYNGTGTTKLRSLSGISLSAANGSGDATLQEDVQKALANNTTPSQEWFINLLSDRQLINALLILIGKSLDTQATFGKGRFVTTQAEKESYVTGSLNTKGLFWGNMSNTAYGVKVFGMENWWGALFRRFAGILTTSRRKYVKLTYGTVDGSTATGYRFDDVAGYIQLNGQMPDLGYIKQMDFSAEGMFPSAVTSTNQGYYKDYNACWNDTANIRVMGTGPQSRTESIGGFGAFEYHESGLISDWFYSADLSCKPLKQG